MIELLKTNMKTERELLQLIINELNEKLDKKEKENMQLLMTISQLKQKVDPKELEKIIPPTANQNILDITQKINKEIKDTKENINNNNIKSDQLNIPTGISFDISQFEKEKDELKFELEKKDSEIKQLKKEKEQIEEQNVFTIHQLRQKISELKQYLKNIKEK